VHILIFHSIKLTPQYCLTSSTDMNQETITFTPRDLNRSPAKVFSAVRSYGKARIRTRSGETFIIAPDPEAQDSKESTQAPDFESRWNRLWEMGLGEVSSEDQEKYDQVIAGER
jgi:hypothetical protein